MKCSICGTEIFATQLSGFYRCMKCEDEIESRRVEKNYDFYIERAKKFRSKSDTF